MEKNYGMFAGHIGAPEGEEAQVFPTGARRSTDACGVRYDLIPPAGVRAVAEACALGARKYGVHNWRKGIPASDLVNHALRHVFLWLAGDKEEDHIGHAIWNLMALCEMEARKPTMMDAPFRDEDGGA